MLVNFRMRQVKIFSILYTEKMQKANKMGEKRKLLSRAEEFYVHFGLLSGRAVILIPQWLPQSSAGAGGMYMSHLLNVEPDIPQSEVVRSVFCQTGFPGLVFSLFSKSSAQSRGFPQYAEQEQTGRHRHPRTQYPPGLLRRSPKRAEINACGSQGSSRWGPAG